MQSFRIQRRRFWSMCAALALGVVSAWAGRIDGVAAYVNDDVLTINDVIKGSRELQGALSGYGEDTGKEALNAMFRASMSNAVARLLIIDAYAHEKRLKIPDEAIDERASLIIEERFDGDRMRLGGLLNKEGITLEQWREQIKEQIILSAMRNLHVESRVRLAPGAARDAYDADREEFVTPQRVKLRMLMMKSDGAADALKIEQELLALRRKITEEGAVFADLATEFSQGSRAKDGGDRGWMEPEMLRTELAAAMVQLEQGQVSPVVEAGSSRYLLYAEEVEKGRLTPFAEVEAMLERRLRDEAGRKIFDEWLRILERHAYVKILEPSPF